MVIVMMFIYVLNIFYIRGVIIFRTHDQFTKFFSEKDYKNFGAKTAKVLYSGAAHYRIENFFRELCKDLPEHCDSK